MLQKLDAQKALFLNNNKLNVALTAGVYGGIYIPTVYDVAEETNPKWWRKCDVVWSKTLNWTRQRVGLRAPDWREWAGVWYACTTTRLVAVYKIPTL